MKSILVSFFILFLAGCGEKPVPPVPVGEMNEYKDPGYGFKVKYPKEWRQMGTTGKALFAKSQEVVDKFQNPSTGEEGAMVSAEVVLYEGGKKAPELIEAAKEDLKQSATLGQEEQTTVGGKPATKIPYSIKVTSKKSINGYELFIPGDTVMYKLDFVGYGEQFNAHAAVFDAMVKSYEIPVYVPKKSDVWAASPNMESLKSDYFTMDYPENLEFVDAKKGTFDFAWERRADRFDCTIHLDVFGAKGLTVEKVWEQNKGKYKSTGTGTSTIDGDKALWVNESPRKDIGRRTYFMVKKDKVIRATVTWFAPQKDIYFTAFDKCVSSIKFK